MSRTGGQTDRRTDRVPGHRLRVGTHRHHHRVLSVEFGGEFVSAAPLRVVQRPEATHHLHPAHPALCRVHHLRPSPGHTGNKEPGDKIHRCLLDTAVTQRTESRRSVRRSEACRSAQRLSIRMMLIEDLNTPTSHRSTQDQRAAGNPGTSSPALPCLQNLMHEMIKGELISFTWKKTKISHLHNTYDV